MGAATDGANNKVDDCVGKNCDNEANDCVHDGVFSIGNFFAVTARYNIANTAENKHNNRNNTNGVKDSVGNLSKNAF